MKANINEQDVINTIHLAAMLCADCELNRLKLEEMMLTEFIRKNGIANKFRREALDRLEEINRRQLNLLGA